MKKNLVALILAFSMLLAACGRLEVGFETTPTSAQPSPLPTITTATPQPVEIFASATVAPEPFFAPTVRFSSGTGQPESRAFSAPTKQVYAIWEYTNMQPGLVVRREWLLNGQPWLVREEAWDFAKYGASGTASDISIYDFDNGLPAGSYELRLYINGKPQFRAGQTAGNIDFTIQKQEPTAGLVSPNGQFNAVIENRDSLLVVRNKKGEVVQMFNALKISDVSWFPDSVHLVFTNSDESQRVGNSTIGIEYELLLANIESGELHPLAEVDYALQRAIVSPDGRYVAALVGIGYADACMPGFSLAFIELDKEFGLEKITLLHEFANLPAGDADPVARNAQYGTWIDANRFSLGLRYTCIYGEDIVSGMYLFDMQTRAAQRTGGLPPE
jgi:hypothetical protein